MTQRQILLAGTIFLLSLGCQDEPSVSTGGGGEGEGGEPEECASVVDGDVLVSSHDDLAVLEGVGRIRGELRITGDVASLGALACLEEVGGRLAIEGTKLRDLSGLEGLVAAESLVLSGNAELISTKGIGIQRLVAEGDELSENPSVSEIVGNHRLTEIRFDELREAGTVGIGRCGPPETRIGNDALAELGEAFPVLESGVTLSIASNGALLSADDLVDALAREPSFSLVFFRDNFALDGVALRERWVELGLDDRFLVTCGNGDEEACMCAVTE